MAYAGAPTTLLAGAAASQVMLLAGRVVQGLGAAALSPAAMWLLLLTFPTEKRARAMGAWGAASALGGATEWSREDCLQARWAGGRSVFFVTLPVSTAAVMLAGRLLVEGASGGTRRFDVGGAAVITGSVIALVHGAVDAVECGWTSPRVLIHLTLAAALMAVFVAIERRITDPLIPLDLFRSRILTRGIALAVLAANAGRDLRAHLRLLPSGPGDGPRGGGTGHAPHVAGRFRVPLASLPCVLKGIGPPRSLFLGLVVLAAGHMWLAHAPEETGYLVAVLPCLLLVATGVALSFTPTTMVVASAVPETHTGLGSGLVTAASQVGGAVGTPRSSSLASRPPARAPRCSTLLDSLQPSRPRP